MLNFEEFQEHIKNNILGFLPIEYSDATIELQQIVKNNETLTGIVIRQKNLNIAPTIYLDSYFKSYQNGTMNLDDAMNAIVKTYIEYLPMDNFDISKLMDFENVKDNIVAKVVGKENNENLLAGKPYRTMADMAVTYHVMLSKNIDSTATVPITDSLMDRWGVTEDVLYTASKNGMASLSPAVIKSMTETMVEMIGKERAELMGIPIDMDPSEEMMYMLSNTSKVNGAAAIIDPNNMDMVKNYIQSDFYILPSSIHEVIILKAGQMSIEELEEMVQEVNATQVAPQDRLSNHVYKYDFDRHEIYRADQEQQRQAELNAERVRTHIAGR